MRISRPSEPSSTQFRSISSAIRVVSSARWSDDEDVVEDDAFWNSSAVSRVSTCSRRVR